MKRVAMAAIALFCAGSLHAAVADLAIVTTPSRAVVIAGAPSSVTFTITNNGPDAASGVFVGDGLPGAFITGVTSSQGALPCTSFGFEGVAIYNCGPLTLAPGASETITITLGALTPGSFAHQISVSSGANDPNTSNNFALIPVNVLPATALVPALSPAVLALLGLAFAALALLALRR